MEHKADVVRLQLMLEVGGMYMDTDSVILKSLDKFRNNELTLGQATPISVGEIEKNGLNVVKWSLLY